MLTTEIQIERPIMKDFSETELVVLLKGGSLPAFDELYRRSWKGLYSVAYRAVCSQDDAMDLVQDVFVCLWKKRENLDSEKCIQAFLFTVLRNNTINFYRRELLRKRSIELLIPQEEQYSSTTEEIYAAKELSETINQEVKLLPGKMQRVFVLSRFEHMSVSEISDELNITPRTVKNQLSNALKILRTRMSMAKTMGIIKIFL